jgi:dolichyl-phosphate-mannose-protein mannosyltransferase
VTSVNSAAPTMALAADSEKSALAKLLERHTLAALLLIVILGFCLRMRGLDRAGFNEDEIQKVNAARAYLHGDFSPNLEHPMLLKSMIAVSLAAADSWNRGLGRSHHISDEMAVRFPNVVLGALTAIVIFGLAREWFDLDVALLSALLWSAGTIAIMDNRLAKEDTLLVFFAWLGYYFYIRAKKASAIQVRQHAEPYAKWYAAAGASFGLMLSSKYFPHYLGLIFLYYFLPLNRRTYPPLCRRDFVLLLGTCALVFLIANPVILAPGTVPYMLHYVGEGTMTHHGYLMMGHFYFNDVAHLRGGMPFYFYLLMLAIKTPLPVLVALGVGLVEVVRRRKEAGASFLILMFLFWIVPFSLVSSKWLRWMLSWMPAVYIIAAIGLVKIFSWARDLRVESRSRLLVPAWNALIFLVFLVQPLWTAAKAGPFYPLYLNPLGLGHSGYYFPHDESADAGLRPTIFKICKEAAAGSTVGGEAPPVFAYYFHQCGRDDLHYFSLSDAHRETLSPSTYLVVQDGRKYFENISFIQAITSEEAPAWTTTIEGVPAAAVYRTSELAELRNWYEPNLSLR